MSNSFNIGTFNAGNAAVNLGGTIHSDQIGTQNQYAKDLRKNSTYSEGARRCAPTNGASKANLRKS
jgi:hypothetical protein